MVEMLSGGESGDSSTRIPAIEHLMARPAAKGTLLPDGLET